MVKAFNGAPDYDDIEMLHGVGSYHWRIPLNSSIMRYWALSSYLFNANVRDVMVMFSQILHFFALTSIFVFLLKITKAHHSHFAQSMLAKGDSVYPTCHFSFKATRSHQPTEPIFIPAAGSCGARYLSAYLHCHVARLQTR